MVRPRAGMLTRRAPIHPPTVTAGFAWDYLDAGGSAVGRSTIFAERDEAEEWMGRSWEDLLERGIEEVALIDLARDADGSDGWSAQWDTKAAADGATTLRATATVAGPPEMGTEDVIVDNTPPAVQVEPHPGAFSPNGDGRLDRTRVRVTLSEPSTLQ